MAWASTVVAMQHNNFLRNPICKVSLEEWAFDPGPSNPNTANYAWGYLEPNIPMNGILPPSLMVLAGNPKNVSEALDKALSSQGWYAGARNPFPDIAPEISILAL